MQDRNCGIFAFALFSLCYNVTCNGGTFNNFNVLQVHVDDIKTPIASGINIEARNLLDCTRKCTKDLGCASVMYSEDLALKCRKFSTSVTLMSDAEVPSVASGSVTLATKMVSGMKCACCIGVNWHVLLFCCLIHIVSGLTFFRVCEIKLAS